MSVPVRGITYDTGCTVTAGRHSRSEFVVAQVIAEMRVVAEDLHCTAVRLVGDDVDRLRTAAQSAADVGLHVWLSPVAHDRPAAEMFTLVEQVGRVGERLARQVDVVLIVGWESSAFVPGMVSGRTTFERLRTLGSVPRLVLSTVRHGSFNRRLDRYLENAVAAARRTFTGPLSYAAAMWEDVDWSRFDVVGIDAYRDRRNADRFSQLVAGYGDNDKPLAALECGCCSHRGAAALGALGWRVADPVARTVRPGVVRDEAEQADYIEDVFCQLVAAGVTATFPFTFASYSYPTLASGPDLDVAAYGIVRSFEGPQDDDRYPGMPWRPKLAFDRLAEMYAVPSA